ncbi:MAG: DUF3710 domain-containing protein [Ornithinimicrobium sp.]
MALFNKRSRRTAEDQDEGPTPPVLEGEPGIDRDYDRRADGPYDSNEVDPATGMLDLGALRVPLVKGMQLRFDMEKDTRRIVGLTCAMNEDKVQVQAFAAPRSAGIWADIRADLVKGIKDGGGAVTEHDGPLGTELITRLPGRHADGSALYQPVRFFGIDGPRWFIRAVVHGPAASNVEQLKPWLVFVRAIVVHRGDEPRPPREVLALTAPAKKPTAPEGGGSGNDSGEVVVTESDTEDAR